MRSLGLQGNNHTKQQFYVNIAQYYFRFINEENMYASSAVAVVCCMYGSVYWAVISRYREQGEQLHTPHGIEVGHSLLLYTVFQKKFTPITFTITLWKFTWRIYALSRAPSSFFIRTKSCLMI